MKYDFTSIIDRRGMDALAVDAPGMVSFGPQPPKEGFDLIPMWIADMNFPTVPTIPEAIIQRTQHTAYGYFSPRAEYFDAIIKWQTEHNGVEGMEIKHIGYANGVLGGVFYDIESVMDYYEYIRITKTGDLYTFSCSPDREHWVELPGRYDDIHGYLEGAQYGIFG